MSATEQQLKRAEQLKVHTGIEQRLQQAIENDVDYADPQLTQLLKDALATIRLLEAKMHAKRIADAK